jgi:hypothetical protein
MSTRLGRGSGRRRLRRGAVGTDTVHAGALEGWGFSVWRQPGRQQDFAADLAALAQAGNDFGDEQLLGVGVHMGVKLDAVATTPVPI